VTPAAWALAGLAVGWVLGNLHTAWCFRVDPWEDPLGRLGFDEWYPPAREAFEEWWQDHVGHGMMHPPQLDFQDVARRAFSRQASVRRRM
jgi:hypothetical protein